MNRMKAKAIRRHVPAGVSRDDADDADEKAKAKGERQLRMKRQNQQQNLWIAGQLHPAMTSARLI